MSAVAADAVELATEAATFLATAQTFSSSVGSFSYHILGDPSLCLKPPVDFKTKVPFWPGLARSGQARPKRNFCSEVNRRF